MFDDAFDGPAPEGTEERFVYLVLSDDPKLAARGVKYRVDIVANAGAGRCACRDHGTRKQVAIDAGAEILTRATTCKHVRKCVAYFVRKLMPELARLEDQSLP